MLVIGDVVDVLVQYLINLNVSTFIFPNELKTEIVKPLLNMPDVCDPSNYRHIALLSRFSKIL